MDCGCEAEPSSPSGARLTFGAYARTLTQRSRLSLYVDSDEEEAEALRAEVDSLKLRIEESGAISLAEAEIFVLADRSIGSITKERVPLITNGELEKLLVNVLLVTFVP